MIRLRAGTYTLEISGFESDEVEFPTTTDTVKIGVDETKRIAFDGRHVRTASISGMVTVETLGLGGVTVRLSGVSDTTATTTDNKGQYAIAGLQRGIYEVAISGYDYHEIGFSNTSEVVTLQTGESKIVSFDGTYLRTAGIQGQVIVEGEGLRGVTVSVAGGPDDVSETTTTDASGQYFFTRLRRGDCAVGISGYDTEKYEFEVTSRNVTVALGETAYVRFQCVRVPPDISGKYALVSFKALVAGGQVMMPPDITGTFSLEQSPSVGDQAWGRMSMDITIPDGIGGTTSIVDGGTYTVRSDGTWEQMGNLVQAKGTYTFVNNVLTVEVTAPAINVSTTVWQRQ